MESLTIDELRGRKVYVDANVFIYFLDATPTLVDHASFLLESVDSGAFEAITGDAAVAEVMVGPYRVGDPLTIRRVEEFFGRPRFLEIVSHTSTNFKDAAMLRGTLEFGFIDALHLATAAANGCDALVTNDARMQSALGVDVIPLQSITA